MASEQLLKEHFDKIVALFTEKLTLDEDIKIVKETLVDEGLDKKYVGKMVKAAAVKAKEKIQEAKEEAKEFQEVLERFA